MLVDSHCHLDFPQFADDLDGVVSRAGESGVKAMVTICTRVANFPQVLQVAESYDNIYCSVGTHPHNASEESEQSVTTQDLIRLSEHSKVVAIGEAGLDYHYGKKEEVGQAQEVGLRTHISAARQTGLPLVIHSRDADEDMISILEDESTKGSFPAVLHCFSSGAELARRGIELGLYISFSGILTFKNSDELRQIASDVPRDRVLVETDSPYLAPAPHRGKTNEPSYVAHTAEALSNLWNISPSDTHQITGTNFLKLFSKVGSL